MKDSDQTEQRSILFADVVRSTELYERLGDLEAKNRIAACLERLGQHVTSHGGRVVKSMGDGILCAFVEGESAVWTAISMAARVQSDQLEISVGLHCGPVVEDKGDLFGDTVNTASRIAELAKPSEILLSAEIAEHLPGFMGDIARHVPPVEVKGKKEPLALLAIQFAELAHLGEGSPLDDENIGKTLVAQGNPVMGTTAHCLDLEYGSRRLRLERGGKLTIGRDPESGMRISNACVSRHHARIDHHQGKFVLEDTSSNGTFLVPHMQSKIHLLREKAILHGNGLIYLGADPDKSTSQPIRYEDV